MGERQAVNTIIQGTASDIIKAAMIQVEDSLKTWPIHDNCPQIILQIHDEVIYEMKLSDSSVDEVTIREDAYLRMFVDLLRDVMETSPQLQIPTLVNIKVGTTWGHMADYR